MLVPDEEPAHAASGMLSVIVAADDKSPRAREETLGTRTCRVRARGLDKLLDTYHVRSAVKRLVPHVLDGTFRVLQGWGRA